MSEPSADRASQETWNIWPIMYLKTDWSAGSYDCFGGGIKVIRADEDIRIRMREYAEQNPYCYHLEKEVQWVLAIRIPHAREHIAEPSSKVRFVDRTYQVLIDTFQTCLRLVKPTRACCPVRYVVAIESGAMLPETLEGNDDYAVAELVPPSYEWEADFTDGDLQPLAEIWAAMLKLRCRDWWINTIFEEAFFADLDKKAMEESRDRVRERLHDTFCKKGREMPEDLEEDLASIVFYDDVFKQLFDDSEEQVLRTRTRIGRALQFFNESFTLDQLYAFLARCLTLETLFTIGSNEVTHQLSARLAKICAEGCGGDVLDYYNRTKKLYNERSRVIHGDNSLPAIRDSARQDAAVLASSSLRSILLRDDLRNLYSAPSSSDAKKNRNERPLKDFFLELELG